MSMHMDANAFENRQPLDLSERRSRLQPSRGATARLDDRPEMTASGKPRTPVRSTIRTLFLSTYPPEECGLATFTKDAADAVDGACGRPNATVMAIRRDASLRHGDPRVRHIIDDRRPRAYHEAAAVANDDSCDVVSIQHEFGLYRGSWGDSILDFAAHCRKPIVTTFHTLMPSPEPAPKRIVRHLAALSAALVVMTSVGARLLVEEFGVSASRIEIIPHGVPPMTRPSDERCKSELGLAGRRVLCTFGLISKGKGLEHVIDAMPSVVAACPEAIYVIVGVTHPVVKRAEGERYRESLVARAAALGVSDHVRFVNRFLDLPELLTHLGACDIYITPYPSPNQIASGTLAYAMAAGRAVVSTPYLYAEEVLAEGRGLLVPFASSHALGEAACQLLTDASLRSTLQRRAFDYAKPMRWPAVGLGYLRCFESVQAPREGSPSRELCRVATTHRPRSPMDA